MLKYIQFFPYFPLSLFLGAYRLCGNWDTAFIVGGSVAVIQTAFFLYKKLPINRFLTALNLFLLGGAIGLGFHIHWLENAYEYLMQTALFVALFIVGLFTTLFSSRGFVDASRGARSPIRTNSWYLLICNGIAIAVSLFFCGSIVLAGALPFIGLIIMQKMLRERAERS